MRPFLHWCEHRKPIVTVKLAVDAKGSVDDRSLEAGRFTSPGCLEKVHELRQDCDAILVGVETVIRDDPLLTVRIGQPKRQPLRVVIDPNGRCPPNAQLLTDGGEAMLVQSSFAGLPSLLNRLGDRKHSARSRRRGPDDHSQILRRRVGRRVLPRPIKA